MMMMVMMIMNNLFLYSAISKNALSAVQNNAHMYIYVKNSKIGNMNTPWCSLSVLFARMVS